MRDGIINGQLASLLARFRHVNSIAIVDGPFPFLFRCGDRRP